MDDLSQIKQLLKKSISCKALVSKFNISENNLYTLTDPKYLPFYYYLGKHLTPMSILEIGVNSGLCSSLFFISCKTNKLYLGLQEIQFNHLNRIARQNIRLNYRKRGDIYSGNFFDDWFLNQVKNNIWDLILINDLSLPYDKCMNQLQVIWEQMNENSVIIIDKINYNKVIRDVYNNFCTVKNRNKLIFKTKYGTGLIRK